MGTIRTVLTVKGKTWYAAIIAFFEVMIWFYVAREAINNELNTIWIPIFYSLGYAVGTLIGSFLSQKVIKGITCLMIVTSNMLLLDEIRGKNYYFSVINLETSYDNVRRVMVFIYVNNYSLKELIKIIKMIDPYVFMTIGETKQIYNGFIK